MAVQTPTVLKQFFELGDYPTEAQFVDLIDSTTNTLITGAVTVNSSNVATVVTNANLTGMVTSVGNAATVVTNANLTGDVTSAGNATTIAPITVTTIANGSFPYTLLVTDKKKFLLLNRTGGASTIVIPKNTFTKGDQILLKNKGASIITITAATGAAIESNNSFVAFSGQYAVASLICEDDTTDANVFSLAGDLA